jgi:hypothetical protein
MNIYILNVYLRIILFVIHIPISLLFRICKINFRKKSSFTIKRNKIGFTSFGLSFYSFSSFFIFIFFSPILFFKSRFESKIFCSKKIKISETPKQVSSLITYRVLNHLRLINKIAMNNHSEYHFLLQPLLFNYNKLSNFDKKIISNASKKKFNGFNYQDFCEEFYKSLLLGLKQDEELENHYEDFSNIFEDISDQRFIDPVHYGNIGQNECAKLIGNKIMKSELIKRQSS